MKSLLKINIDILFKDISNHSLGEYNTYLLILYLFSKLFYFKVLSYCNFRNEIFWKLRDQYNFFGNRLPGYFFWKIRS